MTERERQMAELEETLAELVATGLVLEYKEENTRTRYSINPRKLSEIRALLKAQSQSGRCHQLLSRWGDRRRDGLLRCHTVPPLPE
jgi:hypothetical protein